MAGRVVSVFGPFNSKALVEVPADVAMEMVKAGELEPCGRGVIDAIDRELAELRERAPALAGSALAAAARAIAFELENPYNSLTSKAQATKELREDMDRLRELAPPDRKRDTLDEINERRERRRRAGGSAVSADQVRS